ncbi:L,D-transpeptidase [Synechococcus sp. CB0101]|uniref:L,D-transpeptidase n=1 Tax=Synechococcus sp. CB0101 TaxID=232348 RepID=UPI00020019A4|nr:L,D-transpeptidase [Synechococcus sp. CB0101]QCH13869.1 L,D-transpeptidase [Synechococcus sp. CB0101]
MLRLPSLAVVGLAVTLVGCSSAQKASKPASVVTGPIQINLDLKDSSKSFGVVPLGEERKIFKVGYGKNGVTCAGSRFEEGYTPLGTFKVNAILSNDRFEMDPALIKQSGKTEAELKQMLFKSMNSIDFSGDGEIGEYGIGYVSLAPVNSVKQPFRFNTYDGKFRWYSFAIHGSNNDARIGQRITGGCVNVGALILKVLLSSVKLGDEVIVNANGPCTP